MIVEVITVGTELLLGQTVNTNASFIGARLAEAAFDAHYQVVVGDNLDRLAATIVTAIGRSDAVIVTGGLGPTPDDLTREALCAATGRTMEFDDEYAEDLRGRFRATGREMPENNLRQAEYPEGAERIPNPKGTAPGLALEHQGTWLMAVPGVPAEMQVMMTQRVLPRLQQVVDRSGVLLSRILRTWGRSESAIAEALDDLYTRSVNPSVAFLASAGEIKVRVTAKAETTEAAERMIEPVEEEIRRRLGPVVFGSDDEAIEQVLLGLVDERGWTLGTAESATGGMLAARLTQVPGASKVFRGSIVSYATDLKEALLEVPVSQVEEHGVVSEPVALAMARGAVRRLGVDVAIAVTGSAGPDEQERPAGTMIIGIRTPEDARARTLRLPGDRERVRAYATTAALQLGRLAVTGTWWRT
jgi:nicotinamide-nucleotide amidase